MKRICIIGDSHVAALKTGWTTIATEYPGAELTFFAARTELMEALEVAGDALVATTRPLRKRLKLTSGGQRAIDSNYDAYAICGLKMNCAVAAQIHWILLAVQKGKTLPESSCNDTLVKAIEESFQSMMGVRVLDMVRQITDAPAILIPQPLRAEGASLSNPSEDMRWIQLPFQTACDRLARQRKASFLPQPAKTVSRIALATKAKYARTPSLLSEKESQEDGSHMNTEYGAIVLRDMFGALAIAPIQDTVQ